MAIRWFLSFSFVVVIFTASARVSAQTTAPSTAPSYETVADLSYRQTDSTDAYQQEKCRLDLYHPTNAPGFATVVWFHGGGLTGGDRAMPAALREKGFAVVSAGYRLSPKVKSPVYIQDAAAAVAWTLQNIEKFGGDPKRIFISGHSAGGYLVLMIGLDKRWLGAHKIDADSLAGIIPLSGQAITHFTIRAERGVKDTQPIIDDLAPLYHVRKDAPPILLITGDRNSELLGRYEENAYLWRMLKLVGHPKVDLKELQGFDHGQMVEPGLSLLTRFVRQAQTQSEK